jgi:hypothetical protein
MDLAGHGLISVGLGASGLGFEFGLGLGLISWGWAAERSHSPTVMTLEQPQRLSRVRAGGKAPHRAQTLGRQALAHTARASPHPSRHHEDTALQPASQAALHLRAESRRVHRRISSTLSSSSAPPAAAPMTSPPVACPWRRRSWCCPENPVTCEYQGGYHGSE